MVTLILNEVAFRAKKTTSYAERHSVIKGSIHQEDIAILNACVPNNRAAKDVKRKLIECKGEIDKSTVIFRDFNTPLSTTGKRPRQKICKHMGELNNTIHVHGLEDSRQ